MLLLSSCSSQSPLPLACELILIWTGDRTLSQFHGEKIHVLSFFHGVGIFLLTFCISMALGVMFGLVCSLMLKHSELGPFDSNSDSNYPAEI